MTELVAGQWEPNTFVRTRLPLKSYPNSLAAFGTIYCPVTDQSSADTAATVNVPAARVRVRLLASYLYHQIARQIQNFPTEILLLVIEYEESDKMNIAPQPD